MKVGALLASPFLSFSFSFSFFGFLRQGFSVTLEPVLELALVEQAGLELRDILLPLTAGIKGVCYHARQLLMFFMVT